MKLVPHMLHRFILNLIEKNTRRINMYKNEYY